jgi:outer membrane lipoprotein-sorting protein
MVKRTTTNGKSTRAEAKIVISSKRKIVTKMTYPGEIYVINNDLGEINIYDPAKNTVIQTWNNNFKSQNTTYYYFLSGQTENMGLDELGFELRDSRVEDMMLISEWNPTKDVKREFEYVELVNNGEVPVFMGYVLKNGKYSKKVFYYDYQLVNGRKFPMTITEIDFNELDSMVSKTTFNNFQFDHLSDKELINFTIPSNAQIVK